MLDQTFPRRPTTALATASLVVFLAALPTGAIVGFAFGTPNGGILFGALLLFLAPVLSVAAIQKARKSPTKYGGKGLAWVELVLYPLVLALVVPSLLRARSTGSSEPIGEMRTVLSAMRTYASSNGGFFDGRFECLSSPNECIPNYPREAPQFLGEDVTRKEARYGYRFRFYPGAPVEPDVSAERPMSPTSVVGWAYTAEPWNERWFERRRQFCADASGLICYLPGDAEMKVKDGQCPLGCVALH